MAKAATMANPKRHKRTRGDKTSSPDRAAPTTDWLGFIRPHFEVYRMLPWGKQNEFIDKLARDKGPSANTLRRYIAAAELLEGVGITQFPPDLTRMPVASVEAIGRIHSGIRPSPRHRSRLALTLSEREEISRGLAAHQSARSMATLLGRSPSTVSRELSRNGGYDRYRAALADETAWVRARRPKRCKLANNPLLQRAVASKLRLNWAPEQIAGWLKRAHPDDGLYSVSHETIYRSLFVQARGVLKKELLGHLRSKRTIRRSKQAGLNGDERGQIKDLVSIQNLSAIGATADFAAQPMHVYEFTP